MDLIFYEHLIIGLQKIPVNFWLFRVFMMFATHLLNFHLSNTVAASTQPQPNKELDWRVINSKRTPDF